MHVLSSQRHKTLTFTFRIHPLVILEKAGCIATTKLTWIAVILNGNELVRPVTNGIAHLKCVARQCIKPFEDQRGGSSKPPQIPPTYGPEAKPCLNFKKNCSCQSAKVYPLKISSPIVLRKCNHCGESLNKL